MFKKSVALLTTSILAFSIFLPFGVTNVKASSNVDIAENISIAIGWAIRGADWIFL